MPKARWRTLLVPGAALLAGCVRPGGDGADVRVSRLPAGGLVPSAVVDSKGLVHAVYGRANDVWYAGSADGGRTWTAPSRVNPDPGGADEPGMFRGPSVALGPRGRVHVVWYPLRRDRPPSEWGVSYSHVDPGSTAWSRPAPIVREPADGLSVAADPSSSLVAVTWVDETGLRIAKSADAGGTFAAPEPVPDADPVRTCLTRGAFTAGGEFLLLYRDRRVSARRESVIGWAPGMTGPARHELSGMPWPEDACPTTGGWLSVVPGPSTAPAAVAAWETGDLVTWAGVDSRGRIAGAGEVRTAAAGGRWPVVVANATGRICVSWKESATLVWQVFDWAGRALGAPGSRATLSPHGHCAVVLPDGTFLLIDAG